MTTSRLKPAMKLLGFDDVEHTTMFHPYVTTVVQPCALIGQRAMELLNDLMHGRETPREVILPHSLVVRESSAPRHHGFADFAARV